MKIVHMVCWGLFLTGCCGGGGSEHVVDRTARDHEIQRDVRVRLSREPKLSRIWPECREGIVMLTGRADSRPDAGEAVRLAKEVDGVRGVVDRVEVAGP